jgi:hypothetical protein
MNENQAKQIAKDNSLNVSSTKVTVLDGRFWHTHQALRHEIKIGNAICFYETDMGGCSCWKVEFNNKIIPAYKKASAILKAVELQIN